MLNLDKFEKEAEYYYNLVREFQGKRKDHKDVFFANFENLLVGGNATYSELVDFTIAKLSSLLECPITLEQIMSPVILPSGNTVERYVMEELIRDKKHDPIDRVQICDRIIINRLAIDVQDTLTFLRQKKEQIQHA